MTRKELMNQALSGLLEEGETLMHPIFGVLKERDAEYYGFMGLTQTHLLIALVIGKQITDTIRIPLDLKSVHVKKSVPGGQYVIDISFHEGAPCRIVAASKPMLIDSQKENLPCFLEFLKSKATEAQPKELKYIDGEKIRWQYVNAFIYSMLSFLPMPPLVFTIMDLQKNSFRWAELAERFGAVLLVWGVVLAPFILFSLLNRFLFGKIVAVAAEEGLYLENDLIPWKDIQKITYTPEISSRSRLHFTYATLFIAPAGKTEYTLDVTHFPFYGVGKIKKYFPETEIRFSKDGRFTVLLVTLLPTVIALIVPWFL